MQLDHNLYKEITEFLIPYFENKDQRVNILMESLYNSPVLEQIDWSGDANTFTSELVYRLARYDAFLFEQNSLIALLESVKKHIGSSHRRKADDLIAKIRQQYQSQLPRTAKKPPEMISPVLRISFVLWIFLIVASVIWVFNTNGSYGEPVTVLIASVIALIASYGEYRDLRSAP